MKTFKEFLTEDGELLESKSHNTKRLGEILKEYDKVKKKYFLNLGRSSTIGPGPSSKESYDVLIYMNDKFIITGTYWEDGVKGRDRDRNKINNHSKIGHIDYTKWDMNDYLDMRFKNIEFAIESKRFFQRESGDVGNPEHIRMITRIMGSDKVTI